MSENDGLVDLLDSDLEYSVEKETPVKQAITQSGFNNSHLTSRTGGSNAKSFLSLLSDDSLIEYVNELSRADKNNANVITGTPRFVSNKVDSDNSHTDLDLDRDEDSPIAHSDIGVKPNGNNNDEINKNNVYSRETYFQDKAQGQSVQDQILKNQYKGLISSQNGNLFKNCVIYINGYTKPGRLQTT